MNKKKIRERLPEQKTSKEPQPIDTSSSPAIAKPNVICSQIELQEIFKSEYYLVIIADGHIINLSQSCPLKIMVKIDGEELGLATPPDQFAKSIIKSIKTSNESPNSIVGHFKPDS